MLYNENDYAEALEELEELEKQAALTEKYKLFFEKTAEGLGAALEILEQKKVIEDAEAMLKEAVEQPDKVIPGIILALTNEIDNKADPFCGKAERQTFSSKDPFEILAAGEPIPGFDFPR